MSYTLFTRIATAVALVSALTACGAAEDYFNTEEEQDELSEDTENDEESDVVAVEDIPLDDVPEERAEEVADHIDETMEVRTPLGNVYEIVDISDQGQDIFYLYIDDEGLFHTYAYEGDSFTGGENCFRSPRGDEPNAALNKVSMDPLDDLTQEEILSANFEVNFYTDGYAISDRDRRSEVLGESPKMSTIRWEHDEYGVLSSVEYLLDGESVAKVEGDLDHTIEANGTTTRTVINLEPVKFDPAGFESRRCAGELFSLFDLSKPTVDGRDINDPYEEAPDYTIMIGEREYANVTTSDSFEPRQSVKADRVLSMGFNYDDVQGCYQLTNSYWFEYNAVEDDYYFEPWAGNTETKNGPLMSVQFDPDNDTSEAPVFELDWIEWSADSETFVTRGEYEGNEVLIPYLDFEGHPDRDQLAKVGFSFTPSSDVSIDDFVYQTCETHLEF